MPHSQEEIIRLRDKLREFYEIIAAILDNRQPVFPPRPGSYTTAAEYAFTEAIIDDLIDRAGATRRQLARLYRAADLVSADDR